MLLSFDIVWCLLFVILHLIEYDVVVIWHCLVFVICHPSPNWVCCCHLTLFGVCYLSAFTWLRHWNKLSCRMLLSFNTVWCLLFVSLHLTEALIILRCSRSCCLVFVCYLSSFTWLRHWLSSGAAGTAVWCLLIVSLYLTEALIILRCSRNSCLVLIVSPYLTEALIILRCSRNSCLVFVNCQPLPDWGIDYPQVQQELLFGVCYLSSFTWLRHWLSSGAAAATVWCLLFVILYLTEALIILRCSRNCCLVFVICHPLQSFVILYLTEALIILRCSRSCCLVFVICHPSPDWGIDYPQVQQELLFGVPGEEDHVAEEPMVPPKRQVPRVLSSKSTPPHDASTNINKLTDKQVMRDLMSGEYCLQGVRERICST